MHNEKIYKLDQKVSAWRNFSLSDIFIFIGAGFIIFKLGDFVSDQFFIRTLAKFAMLYVFYRVHAKVSDLLPPHLFSNFITFNSQGDSYFAGRDTSYVPLVINTSEETKHAKESEDLALAAVEQSVPGVSSGGRARLDGMRTAQPSV